MEPETRADASGLPIRPLPDGSDVRKCTAADLTHVVEAVARSFDEDPICRGILPDDGRRLRPPEAPVVSFRAWEPYDDALVQALTCAGQWSGVTPVDRY